MAPAQDQEPSNSFGTSAPKPYQQQDIKIWSLLGNSQKLDGGAMFGHAPKALWSRWAVADATNQISLMCRCLLVQIGDKKVLLETGIGAFFEPKFKERYGIAEDDHRLLANLKTLGFTHEDIDAIVLSHLHFDHAGGLLSAYEEGKEPELLFPNAEFIVGEVAFHRSAKPHPRDHASFIPPLAKMLQESGRLRLVPGEALNPAVSCPWLPSEAFRFRFSHGHTPGQMHTEITGKNHSLVFAGDLIPGEAWLNPAIGMGYDRNAELLSDEKRGLYPVLLEQGTMVYFTHDPHIAAVSPTACPKHILKAAERFETFSAFSL